jgi:hypothetical protein
MKRLNITTLVLMAVWVYGLVALTAHADIYSWTDENGVNHFTNYAPPKHAKLLMKTPEIPYDEEADYQRRENDSLEVARQELAEREAILLQAQQAAERRIAEADARAHAALWEADRILQETEAAAEDTNYDRSNDYAYGYYPSYGYGYRPGYPYKRHYGKHLRYYHYKKRHYAYPHYRHYKYGYQPRKKHIFNGSQRKHVVQPHHGSPRGHKGNHHSRAAAFRGRHGRF